MTWKTLHFLDNFNGSLAQLRDAFASLVDYHGDTAQVRFIVGGLACSETPAVLVQVLVRK